MYGMVTKALCIIHYVTRMGNTIIGSVIVVYYALKRRPTIDKNRCIQIIFSARGIAPKQVKNCIVKRVVNLIQHNNEMKGVEWLYGIIL